MNGFRTTVCGGTVCGCFIGLRKEMAEKAIETFKEEIKDWEDKIARLEKEK